MNQTMENFDECEKRPTVEEYSEETTFHGMKYVFRRRQPTPERIFWVFILTTLACGLGYFVYTCVSKFIDYPLKIKESTQFTHVFEIPFPAVTICPTNKIQNLNLSEEILFDEFIKYDRNNSDSEVWESEFGSKFIMATQICQKSFGDILPKLLNFLSTSLSINLTPPIHLTSSMIAKLYQISPDLLQTITICQLANWNDDELAVMSQENVRKLFSTIITNEGVCFTFNTISDVLRSATSISRIFNYNGNYIRNGWDPETGYTKHEAYPFKAIVRGNDDQTGLSIWLNANLTGRSPFCYPSSSGYKLIFHSPSAYPNTYGKFISIDYGKDYTIAINPEVIKTPNDLRSVRPEIRQCYFNDERQLKYYTFYNENNCKLECYANYTLKMYGGFPFSSPRDENANVCVLKSQNYGWHLPNYYGSVYEYNKIFKDSIKSNFKMDTDCNCLPECNSIHYDYTITSKVVNVMETIRNVSGRNEAESIVEIMFEQPTFIGKERIAEYTFSTLVSDFGGLLGLFMGGSIISIFELIYFLVIRNLCRKYKRTYG